MMKLANAQSLTIVCRAAVALVATGVGSPAGAEADFLDSSNRAIAAIASLWAVNDGRAPFILIGNGL